VRRPQAGAQLATPAGTPEESGMQSRRYLASNQPLNTPFTEWLRYIASDSRLYRTLRAENRTVHRGPVKPRTVRHPKNLSRRGRINYRVGTLCIFPASCRGNCYYRYLFLDVWSRRIIKAVVLGEESSEHAARLLLEACAEQRGAAENLTVHCDNGGPTEGATTLATVR